MSIFLVVKSLEAIKVRIEGDDHSLKSIFRNKEISEFKKTLASETIKFTQELAEGLSDERLRETKEKLLKLNIENCKFELDGLDRSNQNYKQHYQVRILQAIDKIRADNEQVCQKYGSNIRIPLVKLMFFPVISASFSQGPLLGYIDIFMQRAKESIEKQVLEFEPFVQAAAPNAQAEQQEALVARPQ